jgi:inorganic pyrophosphatase
MQDEHGGDEKIGAIPVDDLNPFSYRDLPPVMCAKIAHFFGHYKDLEKGVGLGREPARYRGGREAGDRGDRARAAQRMRSYRAAIPGARS